MKKWNATMAKIRGCLMKHTKARKKTDKKEIKATQNILERLKEKTKDVRPTQKQIDGEKYLQAKLFKLQNPEVERDPTERQATIMFDKAEAGTKAFFNTYKKKSESAVDKQAQKSNIRRG